MSNTPAERAAPRGAPMQACWTHERVAMALTNTANLLQAETHYFLASHTPFRRVRNDRTKQDVTEGDLFEALFHSGHRNVQAIIHGEPGSGKSHLIHWLKLRCDEEIASGGTLANVRSVLVERRNGSLKDALQQIIDQLGQEFARYLEMIRGALHQISSDTARQELAGQLKLELGPRRIDRERPGLPADLRYLPDCFVAPAFGEWLCRDDGTIATVVARLTQSSTVDERLREPEFQLSDFQPLPRYHRNNPPVVLELIDQFLESDELCQQACTFANEALRDAVRGMTGLSSVDLQNVFFDIRRDLAQQDKRLALFIEDVSVMSALDKEVVVALEPQARKDLCDLHVVLGMTDSGLETIRSLPENQLQRATHIFSISQSETQWGEEIDEVAKFTARYLNTMRLSPDGVKEVATLRRGGGDVSVSACDNCPFGIAEECHSRFGAVELENNTRVGLFPFTVRTPRTWLHLFDARGPAGFGRTPRALLMQLLLPALEFPERVPHQFPPPSITLAPAALSYWTSFEEQYCGGWPAEERRRLQRLAAAWVDAHDPHEAARQLAPLCGSLGFPTFTHKVVAPQRPTVAPTPTVSREPQPAQPPAALTKLLANIEEWMAGKPLSDDLEPRQLLYDLVRFSILWPDVTQVPPKERQHLLREKSIIQIEGQKSRASGAVMQFPRDEETADLIRALARFHHLGKDSWNFEDAERSKRTIAIWLRRHTPRIVSALCPRGVETDDPIAAAVEFLAVAYVLGQAKRLPVDDLPGLAAALLQDFPAQLPQRFSAEGNALAAQLQKQHAPVRDLLMQELSLPQGTATSCNFIDPRKLLRFARDAAGTLQIRRLADDYHRDFWGHRYQVLRPQPATDTVWQAERDGLRDLRSAIASVLQADADLESALVAYCNELADIRKVQQDTRYPLPHPEFDARSRMYSQRRDVWCNELRRAQEVINDTANTAIALHTPETLQELQTAMSVAEDYLDQLIAQVRRHLEVVVDQGDPDELLARLTSALGKIVTLKQQEKA
jgi:hypothetical protein